LEDVRLLEETDQDPEVTPGLFQGDLALTDEVMCYGMSSEMSIMAYT
jgi:hypothetical protein